MAAISLFGRQGCPIGHPIEIKQNKLANPKQGQVFQVTKPGSLPKSILLAWISALLTLKQDARGVMRKIMMSTFG